MRLLFRRQLMAGGYIVPFRKTTPAARRRGVLRDKHRVAAERRLPAIVVRLGRRETLRHKLPGMIGNRFCSLCCQVLMFLCPEGKAAAKAGFTQSGEKKIEVAHLEEGDRLEEGFYWLSGWLWHLFIPQADSELNGCCYI